MKIYQKTLEKISKLTEENFKTLHRSLYRSLLPIMTAFLFCGTAFSSYASQDDLKAISKVWVRIDSTLKADSQEVNLESLSDEFDVTDFDYSPMIDEADSFTGSNYILLSFSLKASDGYKFKKSSNSYISFEGDVWKVKSFSINSNDKTELYGEMILKPYSGLGMPLNPGWSDDGSAVWGQAYGANKYEVTLIPDIGSRTKYTTSSTSFSLVPYMKEGQRYTFSVRSLDTLGDSVKKSKSQTAARHYIGGQGIESEEERLLYEKTQEDYLKAQEEKKQKREEAANEAEKNYEETGEKIELQTIKGTLGILSYDSQGFPLLGIESKTDGVSFESPVREIKGEYLSGILHPLNEESYTIECSFDKDKYYISDVTKVRVRLDGGRMTDVQSSEEGKLSIKVMLPDEAVFAPAVDSENILLEGTKLIWKGNAGASGYDLTISGNGKAATVKGIKSPSFDIGSFIKGKGELRVQVTARITSSNGKNKDTVRTMPVYLGNDYSEVISYYAAFKAGFNEFEGNKYYMTQDRLLLQNQWFSENDAWYWFGSNGVMAVDKLISVNSVYYYADKDGKLVVNSDSVLDKYKADKDGVLTLKETESSEESDASEENDAS